MADEPEQPLDSSEDLDKRARAWDDVQAAGDEVGIPTEELVELAEIIWFMRADFMDIVLRIDPRRFFGDDQPLFQIPTFMLERLNARIDETGKRLAAVERQRKELQKEIEALKRPTLLVGYESDGEPKAQAQKKAPDPKAEG